MEKEALEQILNRYRMHAARFETIAAERRRRAGSTGSPAQAVPHVAGARPARIPTLAPLTIREREVLGFVAEGLDNREIARRLSIGTETVKSHVRKCLVKLGARNRAHAVWLVMGVAPQRALRAA